VGRLVNYISIVSERRRDIYDEKTNVHGIMTRALENKLY
jgi:hypothetical protein